MTGEMRVFGVTHLLLKRRTKQRKGKKLRKLETGHAKVREQLMQKQVQSNEVLRLLGAFRKKGGFPNRIALETNPRKKRLFYGKGNDWEDVSGQRFFQAVLKHARKNGASVIDLEKEPIERLFHHLYWILSEAAINGRDFFPHLIETHSSNKWKKQPVFSRAILKMALEVNKTLGNRPFSKKWQNQAFDFSDALNVHRSILMQKMAVKKGVDAMVVGGGHAAHLKQMGNITPQYTYRYDLRAPLARSDVQNYLKYRNEISRLHRIATQFFPQTK